MDEVRSKLWFRIKCDKDRAQTDYPLFAMQLNQTASSQRGGVHNEKHLSSVQ